MAPQASDFPPGRVPVHLTQFGGEFCLACLGYVGDTIVEKEEGGKVVYRVAAGSGLEPSAVAAIEAAVAPGAHYRARRAAEEAASLKRFEGATRLRFLVGHHAAEAVRRGRAREAIDGGGSGGRLADALRRRAGAAGDPSVIRALRVLCGAAEAVFLRARAAGARGAESAAEAAARDGAVKAGLERLVDDSEKVFAEALLDAASATAI
ncbi:hypothetical protein SO694_000011256 [Aureococcus anophagefferens]|uniref:Uncharacterized protein n=1 Tax=Aureococcus anophagefferens TaxID=44056 RepID=A0ABR1GCE7_AURAN